MLSEERLRSFLEQPQESAGLEFKEAKNSYDREKLYRYVVAIANERGGFLIFGVSDQVPRQIVGTSAFENVSQLISDVRIHTSLQIDAEELNVEGKRVLALKIPSRPSGTCYSLKGAYWSRSGEQLVAMSEDRLRSIFNEGRLEWGLEPVISGLSTQDVLELLDVPSFLQMWGHPNSESPDENVRRLIDARLIDSTGAGFTLSNMSALLLARELSDFPSLERRAARLIVYNGNNKLDTQRDIVGRRGYAVGFSGLMRQIMEYIPQNEVLRDALRTTAPLFPERPLRELVANALVHQDLEISGSGPLFEIYRNRVEISNPGVPVVPVERFIDGHRSRNERFTHVMRQLGICEERSSGIDRVVETAEIYQLPAPEFISEFQSTRAIVHGHRPFEAMTLDDKIRACYQHAVLRFVVRETMTNDTLRARFGGELDSSVVSRVIKATVDAGLIVLDPSVGSSRKYARYIPRWALENTG